MSIFDSIKKNIGESAAINRKMAEIKRAFFVWNIASLIFYTAFTLFVLFTQWGNSVYLWVVLGITALYVTVFGLIIFFSRKNKKRLKGQIKDYKSGIRILRSLLKIAAFSLNITAFVGIFGNDAVGVRIFAYASLAIAALKILREIAAISGRRRKKFKGYNGVKAVIFDLDGTLADTLDDLAAAVNYSLASVGLPLRTTDEVRSFIGRGAADLIRRAVWPQEDKFGQAFVTFKEYYGKHLLKRTHAYYGVDVLLDWLYYRGIKTAVVSNKYEAATKKITKRLFSRKIIETIGTTEEIRPKPATDGVDKALKLLRVRPKDAIYVGDSEVDYLTARACGMRFIGAEWGFGTITSSCKTLDSPEKIIADIEKDKRRLFFLPI